MKQSNPADTVKNVVGVAGGTALIAPIAPPLLHGIAGIAVVGIGLFAAGSLVMKASETIREMGYQIKPKK
jgi:hypothetical protein